MTLDDGYKPIGWLRTSGTGKSLIFQVNGKSVGFVYLSTLVKLMHGEARACPILSKDTKSEVKRG